MANFEQKMRFFRFGPIAENAKNPQKWQKWPKMGVLNFRKGWAKASGCGQGCGFPNIVKRSSLLKRPQKLPKHDFDKSAQIVERMIEPNLGETRGP